MGTLAKRLMCVMILLLSCSVTILVVVVAGSTSSSTALSMRPLLRDSGDSSVFLHKRVLLTTRYAPIGFPPPPAMTTPPPPGSGY